MSDNSAIEWTDATWNPTTGCTKVSPGCANCYIERTPAFRIHGRKFVKGATDLRLHPDRLDQPLKWRKPRRVFVNSLSDLFHQDVPDDFIGAVFATMQLAQQHTFQVLTKRPARMLDLLRDGKPLPNVWLGVSVENQRAANERIPALLRTPAAVRFISAEPLLGRVNLRRVDVDAERYMDPLIPGGLHWVIVGGESGPGARPFRPYWARSIVQQCQDARVPVFVKQLGAMVIDRNDAGFEGDGDPTSWPMDTDIEENINGFREEYQGAPVRVRLHDRKGGDPSEWPADLRVREFPKVTHG